MKAKYIFEYPLVRNTTVCLILTGLLWTFSNIAFIRDIESIGLDWLILMRQFDLPDEGLYPFALLEIDESTYAAWDEPYHIPRDKILRLIQYAVDGGSRLVVIDIDLVKPGISADDDLALKNFIHDYNGAPGLIFVRQISQNRLRTSFLEEAIAHSTNTIWASAVFYREGDQSIRRGPLWVKLQAEPNPELLVSVQLVASHFLGGSGKLEDANRVALINADPRVDAPVQKILYGIPWQLDPGQDVPEIVIEKAVQSTPVPFFSRRTAMTITDSNKPVYADWLRDHITIIGVSTAAERDNYETVLEEMPGFIIIANAIFSLRSYGQIETPTFLFTLAAQGVAIILMSYIFMIFPTLIGVILSGLVFVLCLIPLGYYLLGKGIWYNFAIPLLTVQLMHLYFKISSGWRISVQRKV